MGLVIDSIWPLRRGRQVAEGIATNQRRKDDIHTVKR